MGRIGYGYYCLHILLDEGWAVGDGKGDLAEVQPRVGGGKVKLLAGNVHHRQIVLPKIPTGSEGLELRHLKAQAFEVATGKSVSGIANSVQAKRYRHG